MGGGGRRQSGEDGEDKKGMGNGEWVGFFSFNGERTEASREGRRDGGERDE